MIGDLTDESAVTAALLRPLTDVEAQYIDRLTAQASAQLRNKLRTVDARIAAYAADPSDPAGIDPVAVAGMLANVIKRVLVNPEGVSNTSQTAGPFSETRTFRSSRDADLGLIVTDADVAELLSSPADGFVMPGTIRTRPRHGCW